MRIIAGKYKGKVLKEFELNSTRPTADLVRGAIFNIIGTNIQNARFLDLFAGTGAMGIEAISRGASQVVFVDKNDDAIKLIKTNLKLLKDENYLVLNNDFFEALKQFDNQNLDFDYIFIDPPYSTDCAEKSFKIIYKYSLLKKTGLIIWEHDESKLELLKYFNDSKITRKYGRKYVTIMNNDILEKFIKIQNNE